MLCVFDRAAFVEIGPSLSSTSTDVYTSDNDILSPAPVFDDDGSVRADSEYDVEEVAALHATVAHQRVRI